jgi:hypothetical protein
VPAHSSFDGELFYTIISTNRPKKVMPRDAKQLGANINFLDLFLPSTSVGDPDPYVFGPPGSGPISHKYGSGSISQRYGSGSFYHQAKIVIKTLIPTALCLLFDFLSVKSNSRITLKVS